MNMLYAQTYSLCAFKFHIGKSCRARFLLNALIYVDQIIALYLFWTLKMLQRAHTACCGLLAMAHHRAINYQFSQYKGDDKAFSIGLRGHQILPLVYSSSRGGFHYTFTFPLSLSNKRCIYYCRGDEIVGNQVAPKSFSIAVCTLCSLFPFISHLHQVICIGSLPILNDNWKLDIMTNGLMRLNKCYDLFLVCFNQLNEDAR